MQDAIRVWQGRILHDERRGSSPRIVHLANGLRRWPSWRCLCWKGTMIAQASKRPALGPAVGFTARPPALDWMAALKSGLVAGAILLVLPQGIPWSALVFTSGAVMGRTALSPDSVTTLYLIPVHLLLAVLYAGIIAVLVRHFRSWRALIAGG